MTPQSTTGEASADPELLLGRRPRSRLDLARPNLAEREEGKQGQQKVNRDASARSRLFNVGNTDALNFCPGENGLHGCIIAATGLVSFDIELTNGARVRHRQD